MSEYRPTEYVVDFGDYRSNRFVGLNMVLIKQNGAKLQERIVRCRDCRYYDQNDEPSEVYPDRYLCDLMANFLHPDGFCAWGERANFATCECGEDIELGNCESAVCPRCNRTVRA